MSKYPDDDLFAGSTMSFGEHIEELRHSLFRALIGLLIGFGIGLFCANWVVEFIQSPLKEALTTYYADKALDQLKAKFAGEPPPELLNMIINEGKLPDIIDVDVFSFLDGLHRDYPDLAGQWPIKRHVFVHDDVALVHPEGLNQTLLAPVPPVMALSRAIQNGQEKEPGTPQRAVWDVLSDLQRERIATLADDSGTAKKERAGLTDGQRTRLAEKDRTELIGVLNEVIEVPALHQSPAFQNESFLGSLTGPVRKAVDQLRAELSGQHDADKSRRLNRLLVASLYHKWIRSPHANVIPVTVWKPAEVRVQTLNPHEAFMIWIKAAVISGLVISSPWIFWQIWVFVAAGLYPHEKQYVWVFLPFSLFLFLAGAALAFFFVFQPVLDFLFTFNKAMKIDPDPRISEWLSFVLFLPVGFGISFQLPLVMLFLQRIGIFAVTDYLAKWRIAVLVIFVLSMFLTPADPVSMLLMAVPLTVLYFGGIILCQWMPRIRNPYAETDEP